MIEHSQSTIDEIDFASAKGIILSGKLSQGEVVKEFEEAMEDYLGVIKGAVAVNSGSAALHLSLIALGVSPGDEVIIPTYVCTALLNAINYVGAAVCLVDVNREDFNISVDDIRRKISDKTKAIIVPHMFGLPADIFDIKKFGIPIIEDCAQSLGAEIDGKKVGSIGDINIFSFYATKVIATGEGGMISSDNDDLLDVVRDLREYDEKKNYRVRYNYKMSGIHASLGLSQLKKLPDFLRRRREIADRYSNEFDGLDMDLPGSSQGKRHIFYRYVVKIKRNINKIISDALKGGVVLRRPVFKPIHRYLKLDGFPITEEIMREAISIPVYPGLTDGEVDKVINVIRDLVS